MKWEMKNAQHKKKAEKTKAQNKNENLAIISCRVQVQN